MNTDPVRFLVVGHGSAGRRHRRAIEVLARTEPNVSLVGICDRDEAKLDRDDPQLADVARYTDLRQALSEIRPNGIVIAVNEENHTEALQALRGYPRSLILCEKPLTAEARDQQIAVDALSGHVFGMNQVERYSHLCAAYQEWAAQHQPTVVEVGAFWGKDRTYDLRPSMGVLSEAIHPVDLTGFLFNLRHTGAPIVANGSASDYVHTGDVVLADMDATTYCTDPAEGNVLVRWHASFTWPEPKRQVWGRLMTRTHGRVDALFTFDTPNEGDDTLTLYRTSPSGKKERFEQWTFAEADDPRTELAGIRKFHAFDQMGLNVFRGAYGDGPTPPAWTDLPQAVALQDLLTGIEKALFRGADGQVPWHNGFRGLHTPSWARSTDGPAATEAQPRAGHLTRPSDVGRTPRR